MLRDQIVNLVKHHVPFNYKGILIPLYFLVSVLGVAFLFDAFKVDLSGFLSEDDEIFFTMGIAGFITGTWTYLTSHDYYKDKEGNKVKVDIDNRFFYIKMKYWAYIFFAVGIACMLKAFVFKSPL